MGKCTSHHCKSFGVVRPPFMNKQDARSENSHIELFYSLMVEKLISLNYPLRYAN